MEHTLRDHIEAVVAAEMLVEDLAKILRQVPHEAPSVMFGHSRQIHVLPVGCYSLVRRTYTLVTSERVEDDQKAP